MMKLSSKHLLLTTLMATCGFAAIAQNTTPTAPAAGGQPQMQDKMHRGDHSSIRERMFGNHQERMVKRQAELKAKLKITPAQEGAWSTFAASMQPPAGGMMGMRHDPKVKAEMDKLTTPERIDKMQAMRAERMKTMGAEMEKRGAATKAFYAVLSSEQKAVFDAMAMHGGKHGGHDMGMDGGKGGHGARGERGGMGEHSGMGHRS
jgi:periplasmic protein CpxP/Spy